MGQNTSRHINAIVEKFGDTIYLLNNANAIVVEYGIYLFDQELTTWDHKVYYLTNIECKSPKQFLLTFKNHDKILKIDLELFSALPNATVSIYTKKLFKKPVFLCSETHNVSYPRKYKIQTQLNEIQSQAVIDFIENTISDREDDFF